MPVAIVCPPRGGSKDVRVPSWLRTKPCWAASVSVKEPAIDPCPLMLSQGGFDSDPRSSGKTGFREVTIVPGGPNKVNMPCGERTNPPVVVIAPGWLLMAAEYQPATAPSALTLCAAVVSVPLLPTSTGRTNWIENPSGCVIKLTAPESTGK